MLGKTEGKRRGWLRMSWLGSITNSMAMNFSELQDIVEDTGAWQATVHGVAESNRTKATKPPSPHTVAAVVKSPD